MNTSEARYGGGVTLLLFILIFAARRPHQRHLSRVILRTGQVQRLGLDRRNMESAVVETVSLEFGHIGVGYGNDRYDHWRRACYHSGKVGLYSG